MLLLGARASIARVAIHSATFIGTIAGFEEHVKRNLGDVDRTIRMLIGTAIAVPFLGRTVTATPGIVLIAISVFLLTTSLLGWCPVYALLRISTTKPEDAAAKR